MDGLRMNNGWAILAALFFSCVVYVAAWHWFQHWQPVVSKRLTWASTAVGNAIIIGWLWFLIPADAWWVVVVGFIVGGLPAVLRGIGLVVGYMMDATERVAGE